MTRRFIVCGNRPWSKETYDQKIRMFPGKWEFFCDPESLYGFDMPKYNPEKIFFLHWSWHVPDRLWKNFTCVGFHMTDLPFGRGGTPLQNLISSGIEITKLSAYVMDHELDAGPILLKKSLRLNGTAEEIYRRASEMAGDMIYECVEKEIAPKGQQGAATFFNRRTPDQSELPANATLSNLYDHIRMLDAPGYPSAFIEAKGYRLEFSKAIHDKTLTAEVKITPIREEL